MAKKILKTLGTLLAGICLIGNSYAQDTVKTTNGYNVYKNNLLIVEVLNKTDVTHIHLFEYNDKGQEIKMECFMGYKKEKPELEKTSFYELNDEGKRIKEKILYKNGQERVIKYNP